MAMTWQGVVVLILSLGLVTCTLLALFRFIPLASRSLYRYELWRLRDELVDAVRAERVPDKHDAVLYTLRSIEAGIRISHWMTLLRVATLLSAMQRHGVLEPAPSLSALTSAESAYLVDLQHRLNELTVRHLLTSSASGWLAWLLIVAPSAIGRARRRSGPVDRAASPELLIAANGVHGVGRGPLSACLN